MSIIRRKKKAKFAVVRRIYVNQHYQLLKKKELENELYIICQDPGLDDLEYLKLKEGVKERGGRLFKFMNKHGSFSNISKLFGGGTYCVEWSGERFEEKKDYLEKEGCIVLCVLHGNKFHYSSEIIELEKGLVKKKKRIVKSLRMKILRIYSLKWKRDAYITSIKKISEKTD
jgi:hypothetical protein